MAMMKIIIWRKRIVRASDAWTCVHTVDAFIRRFKWKCIQSTIKGRVAMFPASLSRRHSSQLTLNEWEGNGLSRRSERDTLCETNRELRLFQLPLYTCPDCEAKIRVESNATTKNSAVKAQVWYSWRYRWFVTRGWFHFSFEIGLREQIWPTPGCTGHELRWWRWGWWTMLVSLVSPVHERWIRVEISPIVGSSRARC
jgi:hypothetical protein